MRILVAALAVVVLGLTTGNSMGRLLVRPLEERFPAATLVPGQNIDGIIAPGGDFIRVEVAVELAKRLPRAKLVITGRGEAEEAHSYALKQGIPEKRLIFEVRSKNTYENAQFSAALLLPQPGQRWVLVTSASHMPRAVGAFRKAGFEVLPWPVVRRLDIQQRDAIAVAVHEWFGLFLYRFLGRTDALLPGPTS